MFLLAREDYLGQWCVSMGVWLVWLALPIDVQRTLPIKKSIINPQRRKYGAYGCVLQVNRFYTQMMSDGEHASVWNVVIIGGDHQSLGQLPELRQC